MPTKVCKRVLYEGRVQGVGFRFTAIELAAGYPIAGHVRNLTTGDVELVAEGAADQVDGFLAAVAERMVGNIARTTVQESPTTGQTGFHVR
ncbi:MAG TPA: acylphosphatase [Planctomycetales bacterium]|jgi:acylphosphatase|nr:acylphosphatase [Planctomycetales bacterium]